MRIATSSFPGCSIRRIQAQTAAVRWLARCTLALASIALGAVAADAAPAPPTAGRPAPGSVLVALNFDDDLVETGPDTLTVFQNARGTVQLSSAFRWSGLHSVELHDETGDHDFPELLGGFPVQRSGWLVVHFAFLVATPDQAFNIALAGPRRFTLRPDGLGVWLQGRNGYLLQVTDKTPQRLLQLRAFTWYFVDLDIDITGGLYNLTISEEGTPQPVVDLRAQTNAAGHPGSAYEVFSFIGDLDDVSHVTYYVDDIIVGTDRSVRLLPFVAPGRRHLFAESMGDLHRLEDGRLTCLPFGEPTDLGLSPADVAKQRATGQLASLLRAVSASYMPAPDAATTLLERAVVRWREGCAALESGEARRATELFQLAEHAAPGAPLFVMAEVLAAIAGDNAEAATAALGRLSIDPQDPRRAVLEALLLARGGEWGRAEAQVATRPEGSSASPLLASARYHLLLWQGRFRDAGAAAQAELSAAQASAARALWSERAGDAALLARDLDTAERDYQDALRDSEHPRAILCRLADVRFLRGDLAGERQLRERVFGTLQPALAAAAAGAGGARP
jgi:hypothetical protein